MAERVDFGTPITSAQAARAILREISTPIVETKGGDIGLIFQALYAEPVNSMLSGGEKRLRDIAKSCWNGKGADIGELGGLDRQLRRKVWVILGYYFLGGDLPFEGFDGEQFTEVFA